MMTDDEKVRLWLAHYDDDTRRRVLAFAKRIEKAERERHAWIARNGCLVPPDGGSPSDNEREMCEQIAKRIEND